MLKECGRQ